MPSPVREQARFYHSKRWERARLAYLEERHFVCELCGGLATIVHHKVHIDADNVSDPMVTLNPDNFMAVCQACHAKVHGDGVTAEGVAVDADGNVVPA